MGNTYMLGSDRRGRHGARAAGLVQHGIEESGRESRDDGSVRELRCDVERLRAVGE